MACQSETIILDIFHFHELDRGRHLYECLITSEKSASGLELLVFFIFINSFDNIH